MIDFTKLQVNPIPPSIVKLLKENKMLKTILLIGAGALTIYTIHKIYKKYKEDETKKSQLTRN